MEQLFSLERHDLLAIQGHRGFLDAQKESLFSLKRLLQNIRSSTGTFSWHITTSLHVLVGMCDEFDSEISVLE